VLRSQEEISAARGLPRFSELRHSPILSGGATRLTAAKFRTGADKTFGSDDFQTNLIGGSNAPQLAAQELSLLNVAALDDFLDVLDG
jgi:hypothetical protein